MVCDVVVHYITLHYIRSSYIIVHHFGCFPSRSFTVSASRLVLHVIWRIAASAFPPLCLKGPQRCSFCISLPVPRWAVSLLPASSSWPGPCERRGSGCLASRLVLLRFLCSFRRFGQRSASRIPFSVSGAALRCSQ